MNAHPRDEWVEFRAAGRAEPIFFLVTDGREVEIAEAQAAFVHDRIDVAELERRVAEALSSDGSATMASPANAEALPAMGSGS